MMHLDQNTKKIKKKKEILLIELTLNTFKSRMFPIKAKKGERIKILTARKMPQRLPIVLAQVKAGNTCENLLNEIRQII